MQDKDFQITITEPYALLNLPRAWKWIEQSRHSIADDFAPVTCDAFVDLWESQAKDGRRSWGVRRDGILGGVITSAQITPMVADLHVIFDRSFFGHRTTVPAISMVLDEIFKTHLKVTTLVFADNHAVLGNLQKIFGVREGILKGQTLRDGKLTDMVLIAVHREAFLNGITQRRLSESEQQKHIERDQQLDVSKDADALSVGDSEPALQLRVNSVIEPHGSHRTDHGSHQGLSQ